MSRLVLRAYLGFLLVATGFATPAARRVGNWEIGERAVFAVAATPLGESLHFVYADGKRLHHSHSSDGGATWSAPRFVAIGGAPALAVDRLGTAHLVHEAAGTARIEYRSFARDTWSRAIDITTSVPGKEAQALAPRIAVDGANHIHVIYWTLWKDKEWKPGSRTAYWRKPAGDFDFEPPLLWSHPQPEGNARHGALAVDPVGNVHIFYTSNRHNAHAIERRTRRQDGTWGRHDLWPGKLVTDWCIGAAVTADGVAHLSVQTRVDERLNVIYLNNRSDPARLALQHDLGWESYETFTNLLATPSGDIWIATGHIEGKEKREFEPAGDMPNIGTWTRYDSVAHTWSPRIPLSDAGAINLDARRGNEPRLVLHGGHVHVFYAEKMPGEKWRHWQRNLGPAGSARVSSVR